MPNSEHARATIAAGLAWIFDTVQPDGVLDSHHGITRTVDDRTFHFTASGYQGSPVAVMEISDSARSYTGLGDPANPLTQEDVDGFEAALIAAGHQPVCGWNGVGAFTVSFQLSGRAHPSLLAAVATYRRGCPEHGGPFCSRDGCRWFRDGSAGLVAPTWPSPTPAQP